MDQHSHVGAGAHIVTHGLPLCHGRKAAVRNMKKQKKTWVAISKRQKNELETKPSEDL
jgi:hypothetical protein